MARLFISHSWYGSRCGRVLRIGAIGILSLLPTVTQLFAATPVLSQLEMIGSGRGLALTLGADAPFTVTLHNQTPQNSQVSILTIQCPNIIYGLDEFQFTTFPRGCPLKQIIAQETKGVDNLEIVIKVLAPLEKKMPCKQKDNRWVILLSSAPVNDFAWSAQSEGRYSATAGEASNRMLVKKNSASTVRTGAPQVTASSFLDDIAILHREKVEKIIFKFDSPTEIIVKSAPEKIIALFVNAKNSLSHETFKSEKDWLVKSIELKEVIHGGTRWLGASIYINRRNGVKPLVQTFSDRLVIYGVRDSTPCLYLWSAKNGTTLSYDFITPQEFRVDYQKIEKKALSDLKNNSRETGTFNVREALSQDTIKPPPPSIKPLRVVAIKDEIRIRSNPSAASRKNVIGRFPFGALASQLEKKGAWIKIETSENSGWIAAAMAMDSAKVPEVLWKKIEAVKIAAAKTEAKTIDSVKIQQNNTTQTEELAATSSKIVRSEKENKSEQLAASSLSIPVLPAKPSPSPDVSMVLATGGNNVITPAGANAAADTGKPARKLIEYQVFGRDPFLALAQNEEGPLPNIDNLELVGILYDNTDRIGLFEDSRDKTKAFALRENDPVKNGYLLRIQTDKILFLISEFGISRTYAMKLNKEKQF
jgi:hypothetical protein